jgi:LmbE family N-acetylglucosaminyl deacetylase
MPPDAPLVLLVAAHPDDEILGAGIWLERHREYETHILHLTDGSPRDLRDAQAAGFRTREAYAAARRREVLAALRSVGVPPERCHQLGVTDQEAYLCLGNVVQGIKQLVKELRPDIVLTTAYEGGHPDHDAAALAVWAVQRSERHFEHREFPLYHAGPAGEMMTGSFLPGHGAGSEEVLQFSAQEQEGKRRVLDCFVSQAKTLSQFGVESERFRSCGGYDFTKAPHPGTLLYERWGWGISGGDWRKRAAAVLGTLDNES